MQENTTDDQRETRTILTAEGNNVRVVKRLPDRPWFDTCKGFVHSFVHSFRLFLFNAQSFSTQQWTTEKELHRQSRRTLEQFYKQTANHRRNFPETGVERIIMGFPGSVSDTVLN